MTYTILLFVTRDSSLSFEEFKDYYEHKHIPLAYSLAKDEWPLRFARRYFVRISRIGFGSQPNQDRPILTLRGDMTELDCDCIAELSFTNEKAFQRFWKKIYQLEVAKLLAADENKFLAKGKTKIVVIGETWDTGPDGVVTIDKSDMTRNDSSDSDGQ